MASLRRTLLIAASLLAMSCNAPSEVVSPNPDGPPSNGPPNPDSLVVVAVNGTVFHAGNEVHVQVRNLSQASVFVLVDCLLNAERWQDHQWKGLAPEVCYLSITFVEIRPGASFAWGYPGEGPDRLQPGHYRAAFRIGHTNGWDDPQAVYRSQVWTVQ